MNRDFSAARVAIPLSLDLTSEAELEWAAGLNSNISASLDSWVTSQGAVMGLVEFSTGKGWDGKGDVQLRVKKSNRKKKAGASILLPLLLPWCHSNA